MKLKKIIKIIITFVIAIVVLRIFIMNTSIYYRKHILLPFALHLSEQDIVLRKGEEDRLFINGINKRVSYYSTNFRVVGVNFNGRIFAYRTGKAFIVAKVDGKKLKCRVRVIDINKDKLRLAIGDSYRLKVYGPANFVKWKSSNPRVASVSMFGKVKAKGKGRAVITATWKGKNLKCVVAVR
ncbi:MAG: Ig-like domain-containing protein [Clostridiales bacterium]|nr:Ig-like domain-containing protein [Clostridiales bacterium]